ncbi:MAG: hypothetical protein MI755_12290 [Sphingomonadales bacterium]|nr:hypothetical protein [Sphingomonadales bacterium]
MAATDTMKDDDLYFSPILEHREDYYIKYYPPVPTHDFATLAVRLLKPINPHEVDQCLLKEASYWINKYRVPLMARVTDKAENQIQSPSADSWGFLVAWPDASARGFQTSWNFDDLSVHLEAHPQEGDLAAIYQDVPFETGKQKRVQALANRKEMITQAKNLKLILAAWLAFIPAAWVLLTWFGPAILGIAANLYALYQAYKTWRKIYRPNVGDSADGKAEKRRKMEHYYYHCERNPDGFRRLLVENFEADAVAETENEAHAIAENHGIRRLPKKNGE